MFCSDIVFSDTSKLTEKSVQCPVESHINDAPPQSFNAVDLAKVHTALKVFQQQTWYSMLEVSAEVRKEIALLCDAFEFFLQQYLIAAKLHLSAIPDLQHFFGFYWQFHYLRFVADHCLCYIHCLYSISRNVQAYYKGALEAHYIVM